MSRQDGLNRLSVHRKIVKAPSVSCRGPDLSEVGCLVGVVDTVIHSGQRLKGRSGEVEALE